MFFFSELKGIHDLHTHGFCYLPSIWIIVHLLLEISFFTIISSFGSFLLTQTTSLLYIIFYRPWLEENDVATSTTVQQTTVPLNSDENSTNGEQDSPISAANIPQIYSEESLGPAPSTNISLTAGKYSNTTTSLRNVFFFSTTTWLNIDRSQISRAHLRDLIITYVFLVIFLIALVVLAILTTTFIAALGERHPVSLNFGTVMGIISALITVIQWSPQILRTIQTQQAGNLSIVMILILMAGGFLVLFFMIVTTRQNWSTWLPNASSSFQVTILFVLLVIFETRNRINKRRKRNQSVISVEGEEEAGGEESKLLSKTAISTSNASETTNYNTNL